VGRAYIQELARLPSTVRAAAEADVTSLVAILQELAATNLIAVGSGGSFTAAYLAAMLHEHWTGRAAKAVSPLEAISRPFTRDTSALLLTARGTNPDILRAFDVLLASEHFPIAALCARRGSPLARRMHASSCPLVFEFSVAGGRDGFLATNSLVATAICLVRGYASLFGVDATPTDIGLPPTWYDIDKEQRTRLEQALSRETIIILSGGWGWVAAIDLESKFCESALGHVILADFRNFAHGRHFWLAKHGSRSSVITLETAEFQHLAGRTVRLLPAETPTFRVSSAHAGPLGAVDLLGQALFVLQVAAKLSGVDPGQPAVPKFGRRLYWSSLPLPSRPALRQVWVTRKALVMGFLGGRDGPVIETALSQYLRQFALPP
jgi:fructoselysine-6-P-deglycase FrlB-like protein